MTSLNNWVEELTKLLPEISTVGDLVKAGIFKTAQSAYMARRKLSGPPCIRIPQRGIIYPRQGVIEWIQKICKEKPNAAK